MNTPVSFPIAKLLKEKDLIIASVKCYAEERFIDKNTGGDLFTGVFRLCTKSRFHKRYYYAPTIAEVVMRLYEKHGIWIYSVKSKYGWLGCVKDYSNEDLKLIYTTHSEDMFLAGESDKWYNSPTEAYSEAIEYTLKNLI